MNWRVASLHKVIVLSAVFSCLHLAVSAQEQEKVSPSEYALVERDKKASTHQFDYLDNVQRGETWITDLELKNSHVRIPLMREDSSQYSGYIGVIDKHEVEVTWVVRGKIMLISWSSTQPGGKVGCSGSVLALLKGSRVRVLQRFYGSWGFVGGQGAEGIEIGYKSLGKDLAGFPKIERTVSIGRGGMDDSGQHEGIEEVETRTVYLLKDDRLLEVSHSNWVQVSWTDLSTSLDALVGVALARMPENNRTGMPKQSFEEQARLLKESILRHNPEIKDEKNCPHRISLPYKGRIVTPLEPKDLDYPYNEVTEVGWVKNR